MQDILRVLWLNTMVVSRSWVVLVWKVVMIMRVVTGKVHKRLRNTTKSC